MMIRGSINSPVQMKTVPLNEVIHKPKRSYARECQSYQPKKRKIIE